MQRAARLGALTCALLVTLAALSAPGIARADFQTGLILLQQKYYDQAADEFDKETKKNKKQDKAWYYLGVSYLGAKKYAQAAAAFKEAVELMPQEYDYAVNLGKAYLGAKNYEAAQAAFGKAYGLAPDSDGKFECAYFQGQALTALQRYSEAAVALDKALKIKGDYKVALMLGSAYSKAEDYASAAKAFETALRYKSNDPDALKGVTYAYVKLAMAQGAAGKEAEEKAAWGQAANWAAKGVAASPNDAQMAALAANAMFRSDNYAKAVTAYDTAIRLAPKDCALRTEQGLAYFKLKNWAQAETSLKGAIECDPKNHSALSFLGYTYNEMAQPLQKKGMDGEDLDALQQSIDLRVKALEQFQAALTIQRSKELTDAVAKVNANVTTLKENIEIILENRKNDADYAEAMAKYKAAVDSYEEHNKKVEAFLASEGK